MSSPTPTNPPSSPGKFARLRGLAVRSGVGAVLIVILALTVWLFQWGLVAVIAAFVALGAHELSATAANRGIHPAWLVVAVGGAALLFLEYGRWLGDPLAVGFIGCAAILIVGLAWRLRGPVENFLSDISLTALTIVYLPLLASFVIAMLCSPRPIAQPSVYAALVVIGDTGAYALGSLIGRHKLCPRFSPSKTWEGIAGSILCASIAGVLLGLFVLHVPWWQGLVLGVAVATAGALGDLIESAIKRDVGVKDMGKLLPGHGGALDRLDSLMFAAPVAWALMNMWMHVQ